MVTFILLILVLIAIIFVAALVSSSLEDSKMAALVRESDRKRHESELGMRYAYDLIRPSLSTPTLFYPKDMERSFEDRKINCACACLFEQDKKLWLFYRLVSFEEIEDTYIEEQRFISRDKIYEESSPQTGKLLKRAAVGSILFGVTGAALGAATTSKDKRCVAVDKTISTDITLIITVKGSVDFRLNFFEDTNQELSSWIEELEKITGTRPRVIKLDDIDTDLVNKYKI